MDADSGSQSRSNSLTVKPPHLDTSSSNLNLGNPAANFTKEFRGFFRLTACLDSGLTFLITIESNQSIEQLAKHIEAEHWFSYVVPRMSVDRQPEVKVKSRSNWSKSPLEVKSLYDKDRKSLDSTLIISKCFRNYDTVYVELEGKGLSAVPGSALTSYSYLAMQSTQNLDSESKKFKRKLINSFRFGDSSFANKSRKSFLIASSDMNISTTVDDRFNEILTNRLALMHFNEFCTDECTIHNLRFWIDVEIFKSCDASMRVLFANYIYLTYIDAGCKFQVRITPEVDQAIPWPILPSDDIESTIYNDAQREIYCEMRDQTFFKFEKSADFVKLQEKIIKDGNKYQNNKITKSFAHYFQPDIDKMQTTISTHNENEGPKMLNANDLSPEHRRQFKRQTRKLQNILGENFNEDMTNKLVFCHFVAEQLRQASEGKFEIDQSKIFNEMDDSSSGSDQDLDQSEVLKKKQFQKLFKLLGERIGSETEDEKKNEDAEPVGHNIDINFSPPLGVSLSSLNSALQDADDNDVDLLADPKRSLTHEEKKALQKRVNKLEKLFGGILPVKMLPSISLNKLADSEDHFSILNESDDDDIPSSPEEREMMRRKLDKLTNVLGERISPKTLEEEKEAVPLSPPQVQKALTQEEKRIYQKRINKLEKLLGHVPNSEDIISHRSTDILNKMGENYYSTEFLAENGDGKEKLSADNQHHDTDKMAKKKKLDKLSTKFGERITNNTLVTETALSPNTEIEMEKAPARPLTLEEKKALQKRGKKLEQMLGQSMPLENVQQHLVASSSEVLNVDDDTEEKSVDWTSDIEIDKESHKLKKKKLDKLANILGERITTDTLTTDQQKRIIKLAQFLAVALDSKLFKGEYLDENLHQDESDVTVEKKAAEKRLAELQKMLFILLKENLTDVALRESDDNEIVEIVTDLPERVLSKDEKKTYQKKSLKLEQMLGQSIPTNILVQTNTIQVPTLLTENISSRNSINDENKFEEETSDDELNQSMKEKKKKLDKIKNILGEQKITHNELSVEPQDPNNLLKSPQQSRIHRRLSGMMSPKFKK
ncbi:hypothetical protein HK099_004329 [Clydaea vesicula]|uniref:RGS domain-containing protein n=1 Tax=Clydaea vesicula TaxID=447962 RepID=A0AAD5XYM0_9FUNG|nr:hypothetical protein HK099_004329 [Clydaea vesicula]